MYCASHANIVVTGGDIYCRWSNRHNLTRTNWRTGLIVALIIGDSLVSTTRTLSTHSCVKWHVDADHRRPNRVHRQCKFSRAHRKTGAFDAQPPDSACHWWHGRPCGTSRKVRHTNGGTLCTTLCTCICAFTCRHPCTVWILFYRNTNYYVFTFNRFVIWVFENRKLIITLLMYFIHFSKEHPHQHSHSSFTRIHSKKLSYNCHAHARRDAQLFTAKCRTTNRLQKHVRTWLIWLIYGVSSIYVDSWTDKIWLEIHAKNAIESGLNVRCFYRWMCDKAGRDRCTKTYNCDVLLPLYKCERKPSSSSVSSNFTLNLVNSYFTAPKCTIL